MKITVEKEIDCPVSEEKVRGSVESVLLERGIGENCELSVVIVGRERMRDLVNDYLKDGEEHPVLSFPSSEAEGEFKFPPDGLKHLGEIVVSYPWAYDESKKTGKGAESVVCDLAAHGALHLIGVHHD